jgi:uncharacterized protein with FMN-binding domain
MKKTIVIIAAVAILGLIAVFNTKHSANTSPITSAPTSIPTSNTPASSDSSASQTESAAATYKDGTYTGSAANNLYGTVQVAAVISGGKITDIKFLQMPSAERESQQHTNFSEPYLKQSAISKQSANIDFVSGATDTSTSFEESLQAALNQAAG